MPFVFKCLVLLLSIAAASAADKDKFEVGSAGSFPAKQTVSQVTIGVSPYDSDAKAKTAFGKLNPYKHGILPVLVVIQNDSPTAVRLDEIQVEYHGPNRTKVEATPASEVRFASGPKEPRVTPAPTVGVGIGRRKNPLDTWEIEGRAFAAKMIPPGESAHGFFYFQTGLQRGANIYLTGLKDAASGKELFYFEIPLDESR
jgi:hypothetical protein